MKQMDADIIVVAAGLSGLSAAVAAGEKGAKVAVFEKANTTGGAANMGMGPLGIGSRIQKEQMVTITPGEALRKHMYFTHCRVDLRIVREYYFKSGETIDWLQDMGVRFAGAQRAFSAPEATKAYSDGEFTWHVVIADDGTVGPRSATSMTSALTRRAKELCVEFYLETPVKEIITENGEAVGVRAVNRDGEEIECTGGAVILATGGFGANPQMIKEQTGFEFGKTIFNFAIPGMVGDGIKMAWAAGAGHTDCTMELMYQLPDNMNHFILDGAFRQPCLWINRLGERFIPEDQIANTTFTGNAIATQPGKICFSVFDDALLAHYRKDGGDIPSHVHPHDLYEHFNEEWERDLAAGYEPICEAASLEELAEKSGINKAGLLNTVKQYNEDCERGYDSIFEKDRRYMQKIGNGKLYCCRQNVGAYGSLGGILINYRMEALTPGYEPIPGLYAVGTDSCNIFGDSYPFIFPGNTMGWCVNSGRIAGENAVNFAFVED
ncbi:MAG: FAD-dependent oxidoreductase [Clostridiales Family XIII bacterium]|jgi:fumarate reductase flavoprotein subunit|nr:FAD-dependent oxidoreductase [Clostridiales Family XIII bacterium]